MQYFMKKWGASAPTPPVSTPLSFHIKTHECGCYDRDRPISLVVLHVFRDSQHDAGGWVGLKWQFQRDIYVTYTYICVTYM